MRKLLVLFLVLTFSAHAAEPIKIGDISSYTQGKLFADPVRKGFAIAARQINAAGGILGRPVEIISKDDMGTPEEGVRVAQGLVSLDKVDVLSGCAFANVELAVANYAQQQKKLFMGSCSNGDSFYTDHWNPLAFRGTGPTLYAYNAILAQEAATEKHKRWVTVNPNYEWGRSNYASFKTNLTKMQPDAQWVAEQWNKWGQMDVPAVIEVLKKAKPDAIYTSIFGNDLFRFIREGRKRGLFTPGMLIVSTDLGRQENLNVLKGETPTGWLTIGMASHLIDTPMVKSYYDDYKKLYGDERPGWTGAQAYQSLYTFKALAEKAGSIDPERIRAVLAKGITVSSVFGPDLTLRAGDYMPSSGIWVGHSGMKGKDAVIIDAHYVDGAEFLPSDAHKAAK